MYNMNTLYILTPARSCFLYFSCILFWFGILYDFEALLTVIIPLLTSFNAFWSVFGVYLFRGIFDLKHKSKYVIISISIWVKHSCYYVIRMQLGSSRHICEHNYVNHKNEYFKTNNLFYLWRICLKLTWNT